MTGQVVLPSKRKIDVHSIEVDFAGQMFTGETILTGTLTIYVFAGVDANPMNMLYSSIVINGTKLLHRIYQGVEGVIYQLVFKATINTGRVLEISLRQAVILDALPAGPHYKDYYFTSRPYAIEQTDTISSVSWIPNFGFIYKWPAEGINSATFVPASGVLRSLVVLYTNGKKESITSVSLIPTDASTLRNLVVSYTNGKKESVNSVSLIPSNTSTLKNVIVNYITGKKESVNSVSLIPDSGTLI